jgi:opacity protein-like surface antigen
MKIKKHIITIVILLLVMAQGLFAVGFQKPRFYIKFKGIGSLSAGGDFGDFMDRNETYFTGLNNVSDSYTISVTKAPYFRGYGGEIGFDTNKFAVGISAGYIEKTFRIDYHYASDTSAFVDDYTVDYTFSAIPIFLFVHYKLIDTRFLTTYLTIGEGVYLARYRDDRAETYESYSLTFANSYIESKKNSLGFHIGATIDLNISANLALSIEAAYRLTTFKEMIAESYYEDDNQQVEGEGDFYYWINNRTDQGRFEVGDPGDRAFWDGLPTKLNLNGFSLSIGIKITFGSRKKPKPVKVAPVD